MKRKISDRAKIAKMVRESIANVHAHLYGGSVFGGKPLEGILSEYKEKGPFLSCRNDLLRHLHRCVDVVVEMDALIRAQAKVKYS